MEDNSEMKKIIVRDSGLVDIVFSWSLSDIFDENLYKEKVKKIPESFESVTAYFDSHTYPLLEETRAGVCSSIGIISGAPFAELVSCEEIAPNRSLFQELVYDIKVDEWKNRKVRGKEPYRTLPGDIFAILKSCPQSVHDLNVVAQTWVLAHVKRISENNEDKDEASSTSFRVELSKDFSLVNDDFNSIFVVHLLNITTQKRIWNALHLYGNLKVINGILQKNLVDEDCYDSCWSINDGYLFEKLCLEIPSRLNHSQSDAVLASLQATQCEHKPRVQLVWGPPGTGKTKTLGSLLYFLLKKDCRVLICAPTNTAITQVVARVLELVKNNTSPEGSDGLLGNILLFGHETRLKVGFDIEDVFLNYRVKRLGECFAPMTGWRSCLPMLSNFLKDCVSEFSVYVDNELKVREQCIDGSGSREPIKSFVNFFRDRFASVVKPVKQCVSILYTHFSKNFIGESIFKDMKYIRELLDSFETLLLQDDSDSSKLLETFSSLKVEDDVNELLPLELGRRKCISALKTLHDSLSRIKLPIPYSAEESFMGPMMELCFKMASLIFCTTSTSYKLYSFPVEPFDVLVIDEAAQLKECESVIPLQLPGLRHAILFGDECQLPAMVESNISSDAGFGRSLFQRLSHLGWPKHLLNMQYRMHPSISQFPNAKFYLNQILDAPSVRSQSYEKCYLPGPMYGPYSFINVSEGREELDDDGNSRRNMVEAAVVAKILHNLYKAWRASTQRLGIGIISPYAAQVVAIEEMLGKRYEKLDNFTVRVKSVDGFQGGEEDVIIISTVRSNLLGSVGFISNLQRTNVALTRARHSLWVLGHEGTLLRSHSIWETLICNAKERHCFYNADEDKSLAEAMIDIKKELDQLDDLLNKDSVLFRCARWKVLFSDNFVKTFSNLPSTRTKKSVMNLLVKLSNGWRPKKIKTDPVCDSSLQIVKQYKVEGRYVICTNDIMRFEEKYFQVLKIWDILALEDIAKLVRRLDNICGAFTNDFLNRCKEKSLEGDLEVPRSWSTSLDIVRFKSNMSLESNSASDGDSDVVNFAENSKVSESLLLMKFYALSAGTVGHLLSGADGKALDLPFEVTDEEKVIIEHSRSSFILGRSGTGKTTVLTMKLFQKEQQYHMAMEGLGDINIDSDISHGDDESKKSERVLRQLFVTVSPKLCYAIKQHVSQLKSFACGQSSSMESGAIDVDCIDGRDQFRGVSDSFVGIPPESYPLVITFNKFLLMIDGTFGASYFDRFRGELKLPVGENTISKSASLLMKRKEVTYDKFSVFYWPHFNSQLTKKLDASRVFIEIISSIKGGLQAEETNDGKLSMESYLDLSEGRASTLNRPQREMIYNIFLNYEKMKSERGEFDLADLVNDLHRRFEHEKYDGDNIDFVYIDEVQDLTIRQISLFKYMCKNVDEGFVFSGDTAQTIARGIDFRFQDVRCLFFKEFLMRKINDRDHENQEKRQISPIFHLSQNFRTHAGILKLGDTVIQLIYHFFPQSIDILPPETSLIFGEAPILLESGSDENAIVTIFGNTENVGGNLVGFGAEQVILVRDDCVREEISNYVGKNALVLTIVECKGLEFQDVLLYNFFGSSPMINQWRVVYEYMKDKNLLDVTLPQSFPDFNPEKHNVLCSELKQLYVAITRTRQRLWICENKENISKPMFDLWKKKHVVQVRQLDDSLARAMQVASSPEEWRARGKKLLAVNNYEVATMCFERAGDKHWETYAKAAGLEASADRAQNSEEASKIIKQAGELFECINEYKRAADCYYESKDYVKAGRIYHEYCGEYEVRRAGECFTLSGSYELAAQVYAKGNYFSQCLSSCTKGNLFDMGLKYIDHWKHQPTLSHSSELNNIEQDFLEKCARSYHETGDIGGMMKFVKAFCSEDSKRTFLRNIDCLDELLNLEQELGNFSRAADIAREKGDILVEADMLEKGGFFKQASDLFRWCALTGSLWASGGNGWPLRYFPQKEEFLLKDKISAYNVEPRQFYKTACNEILILLSRNHSLPLLKELLITSQSQGNKRGEILVTRRILDSMLETDFSKYEFGSGLLEDLFKYSLDMISQNKVSVETLIYFWIKWKATVFSVFKFLEVFEDTEASDFGEIGEFCFHYLGVRKMFVSTGTVYVCLFPEAKWLGNLDKRCSQKFGKLITVDKVYLLTAARNYWSTELFSTGMKVLRILQALQNQNHKLKVIMPHFTKTKIVSLIYEVSQLLLSLKYLKQSHSDLKSLQINVNICVEGYFNQLFPPNLSEPVSRDMISLRETDVSSEILTEVIVKNIRGKGELTSGQIGRVTVVLLGSRKDKSELYETAMNRLDVNSSHKSFFTMFFGCGSSNGVLAFNISRVLRQIYTVNWRVERDYISPVCFLYLVDRLMVSLMEFQGVLFICRSSLVEWFIHNEWKAAYVRSANSGNDDHLFLNDTCSFLIHIIHQLLVNKKDTLEWVKKAKINIKDYPLLQSKLVVVLCLLYLNSGLYMDLLRDVLNKDYIRYELPTPFWVALRDTKRMKSHQWVINLYTIAQALKAIGDPLVTVVSSGVVRSDLSCKDSIYLPMDNQSRGDLLRILYPDEHSHPVKDQNLQLPKMNEEYVLSRNGNVWEFFDSLKLVEKEDDKSRQKIVSCAPRIKDQVDKAYNFLTSAIIAVTSAKDTGIDDQSKIYAADADILLLELRLLSATLDASGEQLKGSLLLIKDIYGRLMSAKAVFEYFLGPLLPPKDPKTDLVNEEKDTKTTLVNEEKDTGELNLDETQKDDYLDVDPEANNSGDDINVEESQKDDSASRPASGNQNANQGGQENKGKGNKKAKNKRKKNKKKGK